MKRLAIMALAVLAAGCAQPYVPALSPGQAAAAPTDKLCWGYGEYRIVNTDEGQQSRAAIRAELVKRGAVNTKEWALIDAGTLDPGTRRCAVLAVLGKPVLVDGRRDGSEFLEFQDNAFATLTGGALVSYGAHDRN